MNNGEEEFPHRKDQGRTVQRTGTGEARYFHGRGGAEGPGHVPERPEPGNTRKDSGRDVHRGTVDEARISRYRLAMSTRLLLLSLSPGAAITPASALPYRSARPPSYVARALR